MASGKYRTRVQIEQATSVRDAHGGSQRTWTKVAERWAMVKPMTGRELFEAQQVNPRVTHEVRMRYDRGTTGVQLTTDSRLRFKHEQHRLLNVEYVINLDEKGAELVAQCREADEREALSGASCGC